MKPTVLCALLTTALGCASGRSNMPESGAPAAGTESVSQGTPLGFLVGRSVLILPLQRRVNVSDTTSQRAATGSVTFDRAIESALGRRGVSAGWLFAPGIIASARRNAGMVPDPTRLAVGNLTRLVKAGDDPLPQNLASQLRALVALNDGRYAILPSAQYVTATAAGERSTLVLYVIDVRTARIVWSGEVRSGFSPYAPHSMDESLAEQVADLVVAR